MLAAITPTAGGVLFTGAVNGDFLVLDAHDGSTLYRFNAGGAVAAAPSTYLVDGKQYVAIATGNNSRLIWQSGGAMLVAILRFAKSEGRQDPSATKNSADPLALAVGSKGVGRYHLRFVKISLTVGQALRLLCVGGRCNLITVRSIQQRRTHMTHEILTGRFAQALLAVTASVASLLVVQFALLAS